MSAGPVAAAPVSATCDDLQSKLDAAQSEDVITLDSSAETGGLCSAQYTLPTFLTPGPGESYKTVTLQGNSADGSPDGFDGSDLAGRALTGNDSHRFQLMDLVFRDGDESGNGGAVATTGDTALSIFNSSFFNNHADGKGGAVYASQVASPAGLNAGFSFLGNVFGSQDEGNSADVGGALSVETTHANGNSGVNDNTFVGNVANSTGGAFSVVLLPGAVENLSIGSNDVVGNRAGGSGGGGHVVVGQGVPTFLRFSNELYEGNTVGAVPGVPATAQDHFGGGLFVEDHGSNSPRQNNNVFRGNTIETIDEGQGYAGGGQAISGSGTSFRSDFDRFLDNTVAGQPPESEFESEGGGLSFTGFGSTFHGWLGVVAGNRVGPLGEGGGVYSGGGGGNALEFSDSTVAGNSVGEAGSYPGLAGGAAGDRLQLRNSIVHNAPMPDIGGFTEVSVQYSDACDPDGAPFPGDGNICADPLLVDPAGGDIHQTTLSPTIDKGNDDLFFQEEEDPDQDFEGDPRPTDGDGDGHTVDMGADESPAVAVAPPPPGPAPAPPATPQCSDAVDNDGDGAIDQQDPGCLSGANSSYNAADANEGDESVRELVLCGRRQISLVRADVRGGRVVLRGLVAARYVGRPVTIFTNYSATRGAAFQRVATTRPNAAGEFTVRVPRPPAKLFNKARFRARVAGFGSIALKLPQSLASSSVRARGGQIELRGQVKRSVLGKRNPVIVRRLVCGRYQTVGRARPDRRGKYVVRFRAPGLSAAALYRAEATVLARPGSKRYVKQYARAIGITLTGETG